MWEYLTFQNLFLVLAILALIRNYWKAFKEAKEQKDYWRMLTTAIAGVEGFLEIIGPKSQMAGMLKNRITKASEDTGLKDEFRAIVREVTHPEETADYKAGKAIKEEKS